jgi:hypothetical protein
LKQNEPGNPCSILAKEIKQYGTKHHGGASQTFTGCSGLVLTGFFLKWSLTGFRLYSANGNE